MPLASIADLNGDAAEVANLIGEARKLSTFYSNFLETFVEDHSSRAPGIHASEICTCVRQTVYTLQSAEKKSRVPAVMRRRFEVGHAVHKMVQGHFHCMSKQMQIEHAAHLAQGIANDNSWHLEFEDEVKIAPKLQELAAKFKIESSCDGVFTFRQEANGPPILRVALEIKTEAPDSFEKLVAPRDKHVEQTHVYMKALDIPLTWFFYYNKGNQNNTSSNYPYLIPFNPAVWDKIERRSHAALAHAQSGTLPEREEGYHCSWCGYAYLCEPSSIKPKLPARLPTLRRR